MSFNDTNPDDWQVIYEDLSSIIGKENTLKIFEVYKGMYINFPMRILSKEGLENIISKEYDGSNSNKLASKYGYSVRHINRIVSDLKKRKGRNNLNL
ncbi:Mor transcription activator family protein [Fundicoccus culcitae]|uniref:Mor transcription activator domain-containing protein n=1 Tax=Fundicoccus culcitae TaxID=2969821 RepID=A0ABY5P3G6_9LACT|nr:Mor transcription activator family protein [Fundicoccus culcitae]UUX33262.1 hypothetical protein NRE15_10145 [Fundicoccus culcitae]